MEMRLSKNNLKKDILLKLYYLSEGQPPENISQNKKTNVCKEQEI
jgi:hypothetical protein